VNRMAYIGAKGVAIGIFPSGGARYDKDYKYDEKNTNHKQSIFFVDAECHNHRSPLDTLYSKQSIPCQINTPE